MKDYYYILGIELDANEKEIKKAYRKLSLKFHPDKNQGDVFFEKRFKEIQEAYETLSDKSKRRIYNSEFKKREYQKGYYKSTTDKSKKGEIIYFEASKYKISDGDEITFSWATTKITRVKLSCFNGSLPTTGKMTLKIKSKESNPLTISLKAYDATGNTFRKEITINFVNKEQSEEVKDKRNVKDNIQTKKKSKALKLKPLIYFVILIICFYMIYNISLINKESHKLALLYSKDSDGYVLLDSLGNKYDLGFEIDYLGYYSDNLVSFKKKSNGKWGYLNEKAQIGIEAEFDFAGEFNNGIAAVGLHEKAAYINTSGKLLTPFKYDNPYSHHLMSNLNVSKSGLTEVTISSDHGFINSKGRIVVPLKYDHVYDFNGEYAAVEKDGKYGFVSSSGELAIPLLYDYVSGFNGEYAIVKKDGKFGMVDQNGKLVVPLIYDNIDLFHDKEYAAVKKDGKCGFMNSNGKIVIPLIYDDGEYLAEGIAKVKLTNGKYRFIDILYQTEGNSSFSNLSIFSKNFDKIELNGDVFIVEINNNYGVVDMKGNFVLDCDFDRIFVSPDSKIYFANRSDKWFLYNNQGKRLSSTPYISFVGESFLGHPVMGLKKGDNKYDLINSSGTILGEYHDVSWLGHYLFNFGIAKVTLGKDTFYVNSLGACILDCP